MHPVTRGSHHTHEAPRVEEVPPPGCRAVLSPGQQGVQEQVRRVWRVGVGAELRVDVHVLPAPSMPRLRLQVCVALRHLGAGIGLRQAWVQPQRAAA